MIFSASKDRHRFFLFYFLILFLTSCSSDVTSNGLEGDNGDGSNSAPIVVDLSFCDDSKTVTHGRLCAVQPSKTDSNIADFAINATTPGPGLGYHVIGVPSDWSKITGVWIHFTGSYGSAYQPSVGDYSEEVWINELLERNFLVLQLGYANMRSVNFDWCSDSVFTPTGLNGYNIDNCAGDVRREILEGVDHSPQVSVSASDGYFNRLNKLAEYLINQGLTLPDALDVNTIEWENLHVSGHSQGAGHTYYMAKNYGVKSACFLGGPFDLEDSVNPTTPAIADWYKAPGSLTSTNSMGAFVVDQDTNYGPFVVAYNYMGLQKDTEWFDYEGSYSSSTEAHRASVSDPLLAPYRAQACFTAAANM